MRLEGTRGPDHFVARQTSREVVGQEVPGARSFVRYDLFDQEGQRIGSMQEETVDLFDDRLFGRWGVGFERPDKAGTVYAEGFVSNADGVSVVPVLAGTGYCAGVRGHMTLAFTIAGECDVTFDLQDSNE